MEPKDFYPNIDTRASQTNNEISDAVINKVIIIREKLCRRIQLREQHTNFFLTVFKRKQFGNEKIYEKRINIRNQTLNCDQLEFSQNG